MATQIITRLIDDTDGTDADETVNFALDGNAYTIDLSAKNAVALRTLFEKYIEAGTRVGRVGAGAQLHRHRAAVETRRAGRVVGGGNRRENQAIRAWAVKKGYDVSERGRIPTTIVDAYYNGIPTSAEPVGVTVITETEPEPKAVQEKPADKPKTRGTKKSTAPSVEFQGEPAGV